MSNIITDIQVSGVTYTLSAETGGGGITSGEVQTMIDQSISGKADSSSLATVATSGSYDDLTNKPTIPTVPTSNTAFTNDAQYATSGYVDSAVSGKANSSDVYTKSQTSGATEISTALNAKLDTTAYTPTDLSNYYQKSETSGATEIATALSGKVDTSSVVSSVTSASTDNEIPTAKAVYDAIPTGGTGGGKAISAGTNISVTTGETADTVSCTLPIEIHSNTTKGDILFGTNVGSLSDYQRLTIGRNIGTRANSGLGNSIGISIGDTSELYGSYSVGIGGGFKIGNGSQYSNLVSNCVAIGFGAKTRINNAVAIGKNTEASGTTKTNINNQLTIDTSNQVYIYNKDNTEMICLQDSLGGGGITSGEVQTMIDQSISGKADSSSLATVATSGSYDDLTNKPTIPTVPTSNTAFTNDAGYATSGYVDSVVSGKVNTSDNNVSAFSGVQLAIAENTYYGDKNIRTIYIKSIGKTNYTDELLCLVRYGNSNSSSYSNLSGSTSGSYMTGGTITAYTINKSDITHSLNNGVITVTFNNTSHYLLSVENVKKDIGIYYTKGEYSSGQTSDVVENTVYDVLTELGENLVNNNNNNYVTLDTAQDITATKTFVNTDKGIIFKQKQNTNKVGFSLRSSASSNNEIATFEFRPNTYTDGGGVQHPLLYLGHYRTNSIANNGVVQTMVGFRQYDGSSGINAAYHYLMPLPADAKTTFSLTQTYKNYFAPLGFKVDTGGTMVTTDNTGVVDLSSYIGGGGGTTYTAGSGISISNNVISTSGFSTVATTGSYNDLTNKPTIPSVTTSITSASTNSQVPSAKAVYNETVFDKVTGSTSLYGLSFDPIGGAENWESDTKKVVVDCSNFPNGNYASFIIQFKNYDCAAIFVVQNWGSVSISNESSTGCTLTISGTSVVITDIASDATGATVSSGYDKLDYVTMTGYVIPAAVTPIKDEVASLSTAMGGLTLVKLTQSEYDNLGTYDNNTLYIIT